MWHKGAGEQIYDIVGHTGISPPPLLSISLLPFFQSNSLLPSLIFDFSLFSLLLSLSSPASFFLCFSVSRIDSYEKALNL